MITRKELQHIENQGFNVIYLLTTYTQQNGCLFANSYKVTAKVCGTEDLHRNNLYLSTRKVELVNPNDETNEATLIDEAIFDLVDEMLNE